MTITASNFVELLRARAERRGEALAVRFLADGRAEERSYAAIDRGARRVAASLAARGASGERVVLSCAPGPEFVEGFLGCLYAGAVAVPVYPPDPMRMERTMPRLAAIAADARARFVLGREIAGLELVSTAGADADTWKMPDTLCGDSLAFLQYTSGSTGDPKGVMISHANLLHNSEIIAAAFGHTEKLHGVIWLPPQHDLGLIGGIIQPLFLGGSVTLMSPLEFLRKPVRWLEAITKFRGTTSGGPDFAYELCTRKITDAELERLDLSSWEVAFIGAEPVRAETIARFSARFARCGFRAEAFAPTYGLAEATLGVSGARGGSRVESGRAGAGPAMPGTELAIVDPATLSRAEEGEIWVLSPSVARGYWGRAEETAATFGAVIAGEDPARKYLRTGDLGFLRGGELFVSGRMKDVMIIRGANYYPQDIEKTAESAHPAVRAGGAIACSSEVSGRESLVVIAEARSEAAEHAAVMRAIRAAVVRDHDVPVHAVVLIEPSTLPKTSSGKLQRFAAKAAFETGRLRELARSIEEEEPEVSRAREVDVAIHRLTAIIARRIGVPAADYDIHTPFNALGLDSIKLVDLTAEVEDAFGQTLQTMVLYNHPTVALLARYLCNAPIEGNGATMLAARDRTGAIAPYTELERAREKIDKRKPTYQFDLERDIAWDRIHEPGSLIAEELLFELGVDVEGLREHPSAWSLFQWAVALQECVFFDLLESGIIVFVHQERAVLGASKSIDLLAEEEDKHTQLFRRYARHLRALNPEDARRLDALSEESHRIIVSGSALDAGLDLASSHYLTWLEVLFFEEYTIHFHDCLERSKETIQPAWLSAHAAHRREEIQHVVTDVAHLQAAHLSDADRRRLSARFFRHMVKNFEHYFTLAAPSRLVEEKFPGLRVMRGEPNNAARSMAQLLLKKAFANVIETAPFCAELASLAPETMLEEASRAADVEFEKKSAPAAVEIARRQNGGPEELAIIGMACRLPGGADSPEALWQLLMSGTDAITEVPPGRWDVERHFDRQGSPGKMYTRAGGFISGVDEFDPVFFGIAPREARSMDPQHRLLLEVSWEAIEDSGLAPDSLAKSPTGVFIGMCTTDYSRRTVGEPVGAWTGTGNSFSIAAGRISYLLGLRGPAIALDTACSSSLVALRLACQSIELGECDQALVGGVNLILAPITFTCLSQLRALSPSGRCKTFDASADGFVRGEGCGMVLVKRLSHALRDGDRIWAVIRSSATNQDGRSNGITAPSGLAQEELVRTALETAGVAPAEVGYVEAHGTGTSLGDPIELEAIMSVLGRGRAPNKPVVVGSVKTNIGHVEGAAGVAGLIKAALCVANGMIPPNLHFQTPNPRIDWNKTPVKVPTAVTAFPSPRVACVNSFGFSGTNAHVVLGEAPPAHARELSAAAKVEVLPISAVTTSALTALAARWVPFLQSTPAELVDIAATAATGRKHFAHRLAVVAESKAELARELATFTAEGASPRVFRSPPEGAREGLKIAFLYSGAGGQYARMSRGLYESSEVFRAHLDACARGLDGDLERPLLDILFHPTEAAVLDRVADSFPALFAVEYSLTQLWKSWGIEPDVVMGHSLGEIAAACVAGVFSLEDACRLVAARGRLMQALPKGGAMVAIEAGEAAISEAIFPYLERVAIGAVNGPTQVIVSGDEKIVLEIAGKFEAQKCRVKRLPVSHASHSPLMDPILEPLEKVVRTLSASRPKKALISTVTGRVAGTEVATPAYWSMNVRSSVRFTDGLSTLIARGADAFLEIGPHPTLLGLVAGAGESSVACLPSMRSGQDDMSIMLQSLGQLYTLGAPVDWAAVHGGRAARRASLPHYPFQRQRYWIEAVPESSLAQGPVVHPLLGARLDTAGREVFESLFSLEKMPFLADHKVVDQPVVPATAWLETARAAAEAIWGAGAHAVSELAIENALSLTEQEQRRVQVTVEKIADDRARLEIYSRASAEGAGWQRHVAGMIVKNGAPALPWLDRAAAAARCPDRLSVDACYDAFRAVGLDYGPRFAGLTSIQRSAEECLAEITVPSMLSAETGFARHPAILDAALQTAGALLATNGALHLPVGFDRFSAGAGQDAKLWVHAKLRSGGDPASKRVDVVIADGEGRAVAELGGLRVQKVSRAMFARRDKSGAEDLIYQIAWRPRAIAEGTAPRAGRWMVLGDGAIADALGSALPGRVLRVRSGTAASAGDLEAVVDPKCPEHFDRLFEGRSFDGIFHLFALDASGDDPFAALDETYASALHLVQAVARAKDPGWVSFVTRGAQSIIPGEKFGEFSRISQTAMWGFVRTVQQEQPELECRLIELDPASDTMAAAASLAIEAARADGESQTAWRGGTCYGARMIRSANAAELPVPRGPSYELVITQRGALDKLQLQPAARRTPGLGEVTIAVEASGLNFRDVLNTLGVTVIATPLGGECTGRVVEVGEGVADLAPGDPVLALAPSCFSRYVTASRALVVPRPKNLSAEEAATIPTAFLTAWYAFDRLANLRAGQKVLIHAAAGGVGMAAVQLARRAGAEIFATASPAKHEVLRAMGAAHIMNSRTLDFAAEIERLTGGAGVDVVLNSLTGEFITKSLGLLKPGGWFLEMGKAEVWEQSRVDAFRPGVNYRAFDLFEETPETLGGILREIVAAFDRGELAPLAKKSFPVTRAISAFRHMAQARHVGKIVLTPDGAPIHFRGDRSYLITGGLGAIGRSLSSWMVERGARHLALAGRRAPDEEGRAFIAGLEEKGAAVRVLQLDVADAGAVAELERVTPPIAGVMHAAGVLDDSIVRRQTFARFETVIAPKARGAWNLYSLFADRPLDFFVLFSSASATIGSPGQANYAAANSFLDGLALALESRDFPAVAINWGPWAGGGMASGSEERFAAMGMRAFSPETAMEQLQAILQSRPPLVQVLKLDEARFKTRLAGGRVPPLFVELITKTEAAAPSGGPLANLAARLREAPARRRQAILEEGLRSAAARVLGASVEVVDPRRPLRDLGLDSLMAVELLNAVSAALDRKLPATLLMDQPTLSALAKYLLAEVLKLDQPAPEVVVVAAPPPAKAEDVTAMLEKEIAAVEDLLR